MVLFPGGSWLHAETSSGRGGGARGTEERLLTSRDDAFQEKDGHMDEPRSGKDGAEDTDERVMTSHSEMCKGCESASVEEGHDFERNVLHRALQSALETQVIVCADEWLSVFSDCVGSDLQPTGVPAPEIDQLPIAECQFRGFLLESWLHEEAKHNKTVSEAALGVQRISAAWLLNGARGDAHGEKRNTRVSRSHLCMMFVFFPLLFRLCRFVRLVRQIEQVRVIAKLYRSRYDLTDASVSARFARRER